MSRLKSYYTAAEQDLYLYTSGLEYMLEDRSEYKGTYHRYTSTNEVYTLGEYSKKSKKLIKYQIEAPEITAYKNLNPKIKTKYKSPNSYSLKIKTADIKRGFVTRYFIKKINSENITEIDSKQFDLFSSNEIDPNLYQTRSIQWKITGTLNSSINNGITILGVHDINKKTIETASRTFKGLSKKILNFTEYYTDTDFVVLQDINNPNSSTPTSSY